MLNLYGSVENKMRNLKRRSVLLLRKSGLYQRLQQSLMRDVYWRIAHGPRINAQRQEIEFYRGLLPDISPGAVIFDVGANDGTLTDIFLRLGARVVAVEPDDANQQTLRNRFLRYRFVPKPVQIVGKACSDECAIETMWIDGPGSAVNTLSKKWVAALQEQKDSFERSHFGLDFSRQKVVETTTLEQLIGSHGLPLFVKIDVEGYEVNVLRGLKRPVPTISFEVNLPEFKTEGLECVKLLRELSPVGVFNYAADRQRGLALRDWLCASDFCQTLSRLPDQTIEVFWKSGDPPERARRADGNPSPLRGSVDDEGSRTNNI